MVTLPADGSAGLKHALDGRQPPMPEYLFRAWDTSKHFHVLGMSCSQQHYEVDATFISIS